MDTTKITHLSLCSGYGGIDLGLKRVLPNLRTVAYAEIEAFACENLLARMEGGQLDAAPIWNDLKSFPWEQFSGLVDILSGGYPCQPFSSAGKRAGADDPRHLWPFISAGIAVLRPSLCFFENVEGHISLGLPDVIEDLGRLGYRTTWGIFSASEVGAPHQRKRVFIMAHRSGEGLQRFWSQYRHGESCSKMQTGWSSCDVAVASSIGGATGLSGSLAGNEGITGVADHCGAQDIWPSRPGELQHAWEPPRVVGNTEHTRLERQRNDATSEHWRDERVQFGATDGDNSDARQAQPSLGGNSDGAASGMDYAKLCVTCDNRTDELRLLGNGVVPATATIAFKTLLAELLQ